MKISIELHVDEREWAEKYLEGNPDQSIVIPNTMMRELGKVLDTWELGCDVRSHVVLELDWGIKK